LGQNLCQLFKGMCQELRLAVIVTRKGMRALDDPIHVLRHMIEEPFAISGFYALRPRSLLAHETTLYNSKLLRVSILTL